MDREAESEIDENDQQPVHGHPYVTRDIVHIEAGVSTQLYKLPPSPLPHAHISISDAMLSVSSLGFYLYVIYMYAIYMYVCVHIYVYHVYIYMHNFTSLPLSATVRMRRAMIEAEEEEEEMGYMEPNAAQMEDIIRYLQVFCCELDAYTGARCVSVK